MEASLGQGPSGHLTEQEARAFKQRWNAVNAAERLDLPDNRLKALKGARQGQYSIRINDPWRICFEWPKGSPGPVKVEIADYH